MTIERHLDWDGCFNVRDLGGLATADGRTIRRGALVRSDKVGGLTAAGWAALEAHGVRTIVDLRDPSEYGADVAPRPACVTTVAVPLEDRTDVEFWERWRPLSMTPLYYRPVLERHPQRVAAIIAAVAEAGPGGVLVHCAAGRDRTGLVTLVLLALLGVPPEVIAADYVLSADRLRIRSAAQGREDEDLAAQEHLRQAETTAEAEIVATLDATAYLLAARLRPEHLAAIRSRLLHQPSSRPDGSE